MTSVLTLLAVLALLLATTYAGYRDGFFIATYALMRSLVAFLCAMTFCEPLRAVLTSVISDKYPAPQYLLPIAYLLVFGLVMVLGRWLKIQYTEPGLSCPAAVDHTAGPLIGLLHGVVFTGTLLILWSMLPFAKFIPADQGRINSRLGKLDTGRSMLVFYDFVQDHMGGNLPFLLNDEPIVNDADGDKRADPGDEFKDLNANGTWDRGWAWKYEHYADIGDDALKRLPRAEPVP